MSGFFVNIPSPYDFPVQDDANLLFPVYFGTMTAMVISIPHPSLAELEAFVDGEVDVAARVWEADDAAFINWRFTSTSGFILQVRAPMHALLMDIPLSDYDPHDILGLGEHRDVLLFAQDEKFVLCALRVVQMPQAVSDLLAPVMVRQLSHQSLPRQELCSRVEASVHRYMQLHPSPEADFASAPAKGHAP